MWFGYGLATIRRTGRLLSLFAIRAAFFVPGAPAAPPVIFNHRDMAFVSLELNAVYDFTKL